MYKNFFAMLLAISSFFSFLLGDFVKPLYPPKDDTAVKSIIEQEDFNMKQYDLVVSPLGNDSFSGKLAAPNHTGTDGPLKTIAAAKLALRAFKKEGIDCGNVTVWLRGGRYEISDTISFSDGDVPNVTFCAFPNETPVLSGSAAISSWTAEKVNGIVVWTAKTSYDFNALYNEKSILPRTRFPESGYFKVKAQNTDGALFTPETTPWSLTLGETAFDADTNVLKGLSNFKNLGDINVKVLHYWKDELLGIRSYDEATGTVVCNKYSSMSIKEGDRFFLENVFEMLRNPGEWYLDKTEHKLYYVPCEGENINETVLYAGILEKLIDINGIDNISFKGITMRDTDWHILSPSELQSDDWGIKGIEHPQAAFSTPASINITNAKGIVFDACNIINIGFSAIKFCKNVQNSAITRCLLQNIGANAVFIQGENAQTDSTVCNISVTDNHIYKYGRQCANAIGVLLVHANHCRIANNEIHDGFYTGISAGWMWGYSYSVTDYIEISNNLIYDIGQGWLSDMGGIYTLGIQSHTVIEKNVIHDVAADDEIGGYGGWGIYLDEGSSGINVTKNLVYACGSNGFHQHYGKENIITNNIFAFNKEGQIRISRKEEHTGAIFKSNIVLSDNTPIFTDVEKGKFTDDGNLYWDCTRGQFVLSSENDSLQMKSRLYKADMKKFGLYKNASFSDPWFRDAKNFDFVLALNSPALSTGFTAWDYKQAGTLTMIEAI